MPKMRVTLSIGFPTAKHEDVIDIDEHEWLDCECEESRDQLMQCYWQDWANNYIDGSTEIIGE